MLVDPATLEGWHEARLPEESRALMKIGANVVNAEKSLPATSPARTAVVQAATVGTRLLVSFCKYLLIT
jgi:hypothetical protein